MGKDKVIEKDATQVIYPNPAAGIIANLMGTEARTSKKFGYRMIGALDEGEAGLFSPELFTMENMQKLVDYAESGFGVGDIGQWGKENVTPESLAAALSQYRETGGGITNSLMEGLQTGWEVDVDPLVSLAESDFRNKFVPQAAETFSGTTGISSSDFGQSLVTGSQELAKEIGSYRYNAQENAAQRQAAITQAAGPISQSLLAGELAFGSDVAAYDRYLAELEKAGTEGASLMDVFLQMAGMGGGQTVVQPGGMSQTAQNMQLASSILTGLGGAGGNPGQYSTYSQGTQDYGMDEYSRTGESKKP